MKVRAAKTVAVACHLCGNNQHLLVDAAQGSKQRNGEADPHRPHSLLECSHG
jgi:hypothetical protein